VKRKRFSVEQIVGILKQAEVGLEVDEVRQLKQLGEENARLERFVAELSLDKTMLQDGLSKKL